MGLQTYLKYNLGFLFCVNKIPILPLHLQIRQQMLDNTPRKDRAALSQSKGLQNRRLPGQFASKVPEDYASRRRALTYSVGDVSRNPRLLVQGFEETDSVREEEMTEEEKKKKVCVCVCEREREGSFELWLKL